jgi:hypothetical protein
MAKFGKDRYESGQGVAKYDLVYTSFSKENFYLRTRISAFIMQNEKVPISPFMNIDYNLGGIVDKRIVRVAENTMLERCSELWVFGEVSDGMLVEVFLAKKAGMPVKYFSVPDEDLEVRELSTDEVVLSDVSPWVWNWVQSGKNLERWHPRLRIKKTYPLIYPAYSKRNFYLHAHINKYCLERRAVPLNPFMIFKYFLWDRVSREATYKGNAAIISNIDEIWVFGPVSDGVLAEIELIKERGGKVKYFKIQQDKPTVKFRKTPAKYVEFEDQSLEKYREIIGN